MDKIEQATQILESFANSNTVTTHNSSRLGGWMDCDISSYPSSSSSSMLIIIIIIPITTHLHITNHLPIIIIHTITFSGKYMELFYTGEGDLVGGSISTYLLEHVRVTKQLPGERNFHIFYELLEGDDDVWRDGWTT